MSTNEENTCLNVVEKWVALLDDELDSNESDALWKHVRACEGCQPFIQNQERFNECMNKAIRLAHEEKLSGKLRDKIVVALNREDMSAKPTLVRINEDGSWANLKKLLPVGIAALLLMVITLSAALGSNNGDEQGKDATTTANSSLLDIRHDIMATRDRLVRRQGSHDQLRVIEYARSIGFDNKPRTYESKSMLPVNVETGKFKEHRYRAVCFCGGPVEEDPGSGNRDFKTMRERYVLFLIDGHLELPLGGETCGSSFCVHTETTHTSVCWHEGEDLTCVAVFIAGTSAEKAHEMVVPVALVSR